ncbi:hypothetical protein [Pseudomonas sp. SCB32]|uniref:hypothetical protein n=1 Tax=Pseudomonas sp. SCB32 TaxID=2653853 RepID=UPI001264ABAF|nr:hypothetical protein [Pseudomonas sp. SCB32]
MQWQLLAEADAYSTENESVTYLPLFACSSKEGALDLTLSGTLDNHGEGALPAGAPPAKAGRSELA